MISTKESLQASSNAANEKIIELNDKVVDVDIEEEELKVFSVEQLIEGFKVAQDQYICVYVDLDHSMINIMKEIRYGCLVNLDEEYVADNGDQEGQDVFVFAQLIFLIFTYKL